MTASPMARPIGWWRHEPHRLFFPLGIVLAWSGVVPWLLVGLGVLEAYPSIFHSMAQVQGFLTCFAVGFLFTMIPRRTRSAPPASWQVLVCVAAPVTCALAAWYERWALSQIAWLALAVVVLAFLVRRIGGRGAGRRPPNGFVWLPAGFGLGIAGSILASVGGILGPGAFWIHQVGRGIVLQGMFICLVLGAASLAIPLMTRGEPPPDGAPGGRDRTVRALYVAAVVVLAASFFVEVQMSVRAGLALRAAVITACVVPATRLWRRPRRPGILRWMIWIAAWCLPAGYVFGALVPAHYKAGLHISFIGSMATMALAVGAQVALGHGGYEELRDRSPWPLWIIGAFGFAAIVPRALMQIDSASFFRWAVLASGSFLTASVVWVVFVGPKMVRPRS